MFKVTSDRTFSRTVKISVPVDGTFAEESVKATFRVVPDAELSTVDGAAGQKEDLRKVIVRLDDLVGEDGRTPVEYSAELLEQLLEAPYVRLALLQSYIAAVTKVKAGN